MFAEVMKRIQTVPKGFYRLLRRWVIGAFMVLTVGHGERKDVASERRQKQRMRPVKPLRSCLDSGFVSTKISSGEFFRSRAML